MVQNIIDFLMIQSCNGATVLQIIIMGALFMFAAFLIYREIREAEKSNRRKFHAVNHRCRKYAQISNNKSA